MAVYNYATFTLVFTVCGATPLAQLIVDLGTKLAGSYWFVGITYAGCVSVALANLISYTKKWELVYMALNVVILLGSLVPCGANLVGR